MSHSKANGLSNYCAIF